MITSRIARGESSPGPSTGAVSPAWVPAAGAITLACAGMGLPDPVELEQELTGVEVDALLRWFAVADDVARALSAGVDRLGGALGALAAGWSSPAPRVAVMRQWEAVRASERIIRDQIDAVDATSAILRQSRLLAQGRVAGTEGALRRMGWPAGEDLLAWAASNAALPAVNALLSMACDELSDCRHRNDAALHDLATALRSDPGQPAQQLMPARPAAGAHVGPGGLSSGARSTGPPHSPTSKASALQGVDEANADRLSADLRSTDVSTALMALGVTGALARARENGQEAHLLVYESANSASQGRAAIGIGDLSAADNVAIVVPGIGNAPVEMADGISDATALLQESQRQAPDDATSVIAWYGYDIPFSSVSGVPVTPAVAIGNAAAATDDDSARTGGAALNRDLAAFGAIAPASARWIAVGFSMGSTTVSAAAAGGRRIDDLVMLGSPGAGRQVGSAEDYRSVSPDHTFVTSFEQDPVTLPETDLLAAFAGAALKFPPRAAPFGPDPAAKSFGAQVVDVGSNEPDVDVQLGPVTGALGRLDSLITNEVVDLAGHHQQSNYLGGASLQAVAAVVVGHYADVPIKPGR